MEQGHVSKPRSKGGSYLERGAYWKEGVRFITVFQCDVTEIIIMCVATNRGYYWKICDVRNNFPVNYTKKSSY